MAYFAFCVLLFDTELRLVLIPETPQLLFMMTQLFFAAAARKTGIGLLGKAFGMTTECDFPSQEQKQRHSE